MSRNVLRRLWAAVPVRASRYKRALVQAMDANTKALDYADRHAKVMVLNTELATSEREAQAAARQAESRMAVMQRNYAAWMHERGDGPKILVMPDDRQRWIFPVLNGPVRFEEGASWAEPPMIQERSVEMRRIRAEVHIGLDATIPPEAVAIRLADLVRDAVLSSWRSQSVLLQEMKP